MIFKRIFAFIKDKNFAFIALAAEGINPALFNGTKSGGWAATQAKSEPHANEKG